jgi:RNA polymerase sigma factor (sigma-70 family)
MSESNLDLQQIKQQIYRYCLKITTNKWEAEDLTQDVLFKVHKAMGVNPDREISNAYLYRIALNTWKDKQKKHNLQVVPLDESHLNHSKTDMQLFTRELLETLAHRLSPRALIILLLMDVFDFTAKETAELISSTEGTVQVTLGRARIRLKKLAQGADSNNLESKQLDHIAQLDFNSLVEAFRVRDPKAICRSYIGLVRQHITISRLRIINGNLTFYFEDPDGNRFMVTA